MRSSISRVPLLLVAASLLVAVAGGCRSGSGGDEGPVDPDRIGPEELLEVPDLTAYQAVQRLRPTWLRARAGTLTGGGGVRHTAEVLVDGLHMGDLNALQDLNVRDVQEIRYMSASDATMRYGTGYPGGIIHVTTKKGL